MSIGIHVGRETADRLGVKTYGAAIKELRGIGAKASQIFVMNPQSTEFVNFGSASDIRRAQRDDT